MGLQPTNVMKTPCSARTPACRVHTRVNARNLLKRCSQECEHGTLRSVRHGGDRRLQRSDHGPLAHQS
jgi:hypothetical protein